MRLRIYLLLLLAGVVKAELSVHTDFPGGSARVTHLDSEQQLIRMVPFAFKGKGWDCWWCCRVEGLVTNRIFTLELSGMAFARPDRAMMSMDGKSWRHTTPAAKKQGMHRFTFQPPASTLWLAWGPPFQLGDAQVLVDRAAAVCPEAERFTLATSREGRKVPALRCAPKQEARRHVWIQARQHAWECGSSWVCRGLVEWLVSDTPEAVALRSSTALTVVPVMDADNVERGAGGKNQQPQDHNRDWNAAPHWPEVRAAQAGIRAMDRTGNFALFVDLHNPGPGDRDPYFYLPENDLLDEPRRALVKRFLAEANTHMSRVPLAFKGQTRISGRNYDKKNWKKISKNWVSENTQSPAVAVTLETAWNTPHSTPGGYRQVGAALGRAIAAFVAGLETTAE